jgi:hypothetical protein
MSIKLPMARIHLNNILEIETIFKNNFESYSIRTNDIIYDDIQDIVSSGVKKLFVLSFKGVNPNIDLDIRSYGASVTEYTKAEHLNPIAYLIKDVYLKNKSYFVNNITTDLLPWLLVMSANIIVTLKIKGAIGVAMGFVIILSYVAISIGLKTLFNIPKYCVVRFYDSFSVHEFLNNNRDQLLVGIITGLFGAIIGFICGYLLK